MKANASLLLLALFTTAAGACGNRLLVGNDPDGGAPPLTPTGAAGTSPPATGDASAAGIGGAIDAPLGTGFGGAIDAPLGTGTGSGGSGPPTTTRIVTRLQISGEEALSRVASVVWMEAPSADLLSQAQLGHFKTTDNLYFAIRQLLADPRARIGLGAFYRWWLQLDRLADIKKDPQLFPTFTPQLKADMAAETETFGVNVTLMKGSTLGILMTAPFSYINERLAAVYGVSGITGDALRQVVLDPTQRAGLLTQPALQALTSFEARNSPSARGSYIVTRFQCVQVPPPPPNLSGLDPLPTNVTVRQALAQSVGGQAACAACHKLLDPPGLPFETFDAIGRWRTTDNGFPIDVSGISILNLADSPITVDGPIALANAMPRSPQVQECVARQWLSFVTGKAVYELDDRVVQAVTGTFRDSGLDLKELIAAVLTSDTFLAPR